MALSKRLRDYLRRPGLRPHTKEEARYVQPPGADPGMIEDAPDEVFYFWVETTAADAYDFDRSLSDDQIAQWISDRRTLYHVGAGSEAEARLSVESIEDVNANGYGGHGGAPWTLTDVRPATANVDPSGESDVRA